MAVGVDSVTRPRRLVAAEACVAGRDSVTRLRRLVAAEAWAVGRDSVTRLRRLVAAEAWVQQAGRPRVMWPWRLGAGALP